jgi:hypothetical protein
MAETMPYPKQFVRQILVIDAKNERNDGPSTPQFNTWTSCREFGKDPTFDEVTTRPIVRDRKGKKGTEAQAAPRTNQD